MDGTGKEKIGKEEEKEGAHNASSVLGVPSPVALGCWGAAAEKDE
jgi:hypothetical protein